MITTIQIIQDIILKSKATGSMKVALRECEHALKALQRRIVKPSLSIQEVFLLTLIIEQTIEENITHSIKYISNHLMCNKLDLIEILPILENLKKINVLHVDRKSNSGSNDAFQVYYIDQDLIKSLNAPKIQINVQLQNKLSNLNQFIRKLNKYQKDKAYCNITSSEFTQLVYELYEGNQHLFFVKNSLQLLEQDGYYLSNRDDFEFFIESTSGFMYSPMIQLLLFAKIIEVVKTGQVLFTYSDLCDRESGFDDHYIDNSFLEDESHPLFQLKLLGYKKSDMPEAPIEFEIKQEFVEYFLGAEAKSITDLANNSQLILPSNIPPKEMFFQKDFQDQVKVLESLMQKDKFNELVESFKQQKYGVKGLVVLFEGPPGSGKTELAMQLAKLSNRSIYKVDLSEQKGSYLGESERNIKRLFSQYKIYCKLNQQVPILLFNEADAVFSRRVEISRSVDQTMNAVQNIILDELDSFEGILIATTNLSVNFDAAFDRRFLFKIKFEQPTKDVRARIWGNRCQHIDQHLANELSSRYELSPAQIDNVFKKISLHELLRNKIDKAFIHQLCIDELGEKSKVKIGYL